MQKISWYWRWLVVAGLSGVILWWCTTGWKSEPSIDWSSRFAAAEVEKGFADVSRHPAYDSIIRDVSRDAELLAARYSEDPQALFLAGQLHDRIGQPATAVQLWQQCLHHDPSNAEARLAIGMLLFESGDFDDAEPLLKDAFLQSRNPKAGYLLASLLLNRGKLDQTAEVLEASLSAAPDSLPNQVLLGQVRLQQQQPAKAKERFLAASKLAPEHASVWFGLATAARQLGQHVEADRYRATFQDLQRRQLQEEIEQTKHHDDLRMMREDLATNYVAVGRLFGERGDEAAAEHHLQQALQFNDGSLEARVSLASLYQRQKRFEQGVATLSPLSMSSSKDVGFWLQLGNLYSQLDAFEQSDQAFVRVVELRPDWAQGYAARAELHLRFDRSSDDVVQMAREAVERQPNAAHYFLLSVATQRIGNLARARRAAEQAIQLDPKDPQYQHWYLLIHEQR